MARDEKKKKHAYGQIFATNEELGDFVGRYAVLLLDRLLKREQLHGGLEDIIYPDTANLSSTINTTVANITITHH